MNIYTTDKIRNVVLLGHGGCGKTSLVEAMAYLSGITSRLGKVEDGNTVSDFGKEEQKRKISISSSVVPIEWGGYKINVIDTPGFFDFAGEVEEAISAAGAAIIVIAVNNSFKYRYSPITICKEIVIGYPQHFNKSMVLFIMKFYTAADIVKHIFYRTGTYFSAEMSDKCAVVAVVRTAS